jgi:hypothetical protein
MSQDLTHAEARAAFRELAKAIGPKCNIYPTLNLYDERGCDINTSVYPNGLTGREREQFSVKANTYREALAKIEEAWAERSDTYAAKTIREMALAIISITADQGECSDAALRAQFDAADVIRFGERAVAQANEIASTGPFTIVRLSGANDAEAA